jgi:hypothetical protein
VNIALGSAPMSTCPIGDFDKSGDITVNEIIRAVGFALGACPSANLTPTPAPVPPAPPLPPLSAPLVGYGVRLPV